MHLDENDSNSDYLWTYYFDTVPENSPTVTVTVYKMDYSTQPGTGEVLTEFTVPLS